VLSPAHPDFATSLNNLAELYERQGHYGEAEPLAAVFDRLDRDHDGTLDRRELRGRLNAAQFAAQIRTMMEH
jgi:Ca2+-binding EF-hand superfamily protein